MKKVLEPIIGKFDEKVFYPLILLIFAALTFIVIDNKGFQSVFDAANQWLIFNCAWIFQLVTFICIAFGFWLALSRYGTLKLGAQDDTPEFSTPAWVSMMFSAGFGITMWMWCSAEVIYHLYTSAAVADAGATGQAKGVPIALQSVFMDWCLHGWMLFAVGGFAVAFPAYRLGRPMNLAAGLYGLLREKTYTSPWGKVTDIAGAVAALGGTAAALGFGLMMISYGLKTVFGVEIGFTGKAVAMFLLVAAFVASAVSGIQKGIKVLSLANVIMSILLCAFLALAGPTNYIFTTITESLGLYIGNFAELSLWGDAGNFTDGIWKTRGWNNWWLVFFILWWASYIPFCGGFIARISKGRTVREYILGSVILPSVITIIFFGVWSTASAHLQITNAAPIWDHIQNDFGSTIYEVLKQYPMATFTCLFVFVSSILYGITTYDSTTYFISMQVAGGEAHPKIFMRILWGLVIGILGLVFLSIDNFDAMKALAIVCGAPFFIVLIFYMVSIVKMLKMADNGEM